MYFKERGSRVQNESMYSKTGTCGKGILQHHALCNDVFICKALYILICIQLFSFLISTVFIVARFNCERYF